MVAATNNNILSLRLTLRQYCVFETLESVFRLSERECGEPHNTDFGRFR